MARRAGWRLRDRHRAGNHEVGLAYYLTRFPTYTIIYGAFATLPIFLLWIYLSWLAVLLGATLAASAPLIRLGRWEINRYRARPTSMRWTRCARCRAQAANPPGLAASALARQLRLHQDELNAVLETLNDMGLIARSTEGNWMLACDARQTSMTPVVERFLLDQTRPRVRNDAEILRVAASVLGGQPVPTLEDLCQEAKYRK